MTDRAEGKNDAAALGKVRRHARILVDIGRLAGAGSDPDHFLQQVVVQIARAIEIDHVKILEYRPRTADLLLVAGLGWKEGAVGAAALSAGFASAPGRAFQTAEAVTIKNFSEQDEYVLSDFLREHGIVSLTNVPLMIDGAAWGVLEVDSATPRDFSEDTTDFMAAAGAMVGVFLKRKRPQSDERAQLLAAATEAMTRDLLLVEMQHRVKNNFQLILASIAIQKRRYKNAEALRALDHVASRINAISLAHDQLAPRQDRQIVKLSDYIRALAFSIGQQADNVTIQVEADELELTIERAVSLGLILNETVTNSIKHAFGAEGGGVTIKLSGAVGYGEARLTISDDGAGIAGSDKGGSGLKLIGSLARQIGGAIKQDSSDRGTTTRLTFPLIS